MTVTAQRILTELGNRAWAGFNKDDMVFGNEDAVQALTEVNIALRYLINLESFPFRAKEKSVTTSANSAYINVPDGQITTIYDTETFNHLEFIGDNTICDKEQKGTPSGYWIDYNNPTARVRLFPIPDKTYNLKVIYNQFKPVISKDNTQAFEFTKADDYINLPANLEFLFMDCLVLRTMITNNKDQEDENYVPMINEFNEAWRVFTKACKPVKLNVRVVW